jgi:hypothetical protein
MTNALAKYAAICVDLCQSKEAVPGVTAPSPSPTELSPPSTEKHAAATQPVEPAALYATWLKLALAEAKAEAALQQRLCLLLSNQWKDTAHDWMGQTSLDIEGNLDALDFSLLQPPSWSASLMGARRKRARAFFRQVEAIVATEHRFKVESRKLLDRHKSRTALIVRDALELELDSHQLTHFLTDIKRCLALLSSALVDDPANGSELALFAERAAVILDKLVAINNAALRALGSLRSSIQQGEAILELLRGKWAHAFKAWESTMTALADEIYFAGSASEMLDEPVRLHDGLRALLSEIRALCASSAKQDNRLVQHLSDASGATFAQKVQLPGQAL